MSLGIDELFLEQVEPLKAKLRADIQAVADLKSGSIQSYELESGQTRQKVSMANLQTLENAISSTMNLLTTLEARLCGTGVTHFVPAN